MISKENIKQLQTAIMMLGKYEAIVDGLCRLIALIECSFADISREALANRASDIREDAMTAYTITTESDHLHLESFMYRYLERKLWQTYVDIQYERSQ